MIAIFIIDATASNPVDRVWTYPTTEAAEADLRDEDCFGLAEDDADELVKNGVLYIDKRTIYKFIACQAG